MRKLLSVLLYSYTLIASATDYYVSSSGNDSADGLTQSTAWRTISKVNSEFYRFNPGDRILFRRGDVFTGTINVTKSGTSGNPITLSSFGTGNLPIISGFVTVTNWNDEGNGIYSRVVSCESFPNLLIIDGKNTPLGRWPNSGWKTIDSHYGTTSLSDAELPSYPNFTGGEVVVRPEAWVINRENITSHSGQTLNFSSLNYEPHNGDGYFIQNHINTLDAFGEWYYDGSKLYVFFGAGNNPSNYTVKLSTLNQLVRIVSRYYITIDYLEFQGANVAAIYYEESDNVTIQNCSIRYSGQIGIREGWGSDYTRITNNLISNCNHGGIYLSHSTNYASILNNRIEYSGVICGMGANNDDSYSGIVCQGNNSLISYNDVVNSGYIGIRWGGQSSEVSYNFVNYSCLCKDDGGGIYTYNDETTNKVLKNNIILNSTAQPDGFNNHETNRSHGIYVDGADNISIVNNVAASNGGYGLFINEARNINTNGNTCYDNVYGTYITSNTGDTYARNQSHTDNIYFARTSSQYSFGVITKDGLSEIPNFGSSDYNYFVRPVNNDNYIVVWYYAWGGNRYEYNLSEWQSTSNGKDSHSNTTPVTVTDVGKIRFEYNASNSNRTVSLGGDYIDSKGNKYPGSITLAPYTAAVLIVDPNPSTPPPAPKFVSSSVENATPNTITINFDLALANVVPPTSAFTVNVNSNPVTVSSITISGSQVILRLSSSLTYRDVITVSYTRPASNPLQSTAGQTVESFGSKSVSNNIYSPSPTFVSAVVENTKPSVIEITYSLPLANIIPDVSCFNVRVNSNSRSVTSISISNTKVLLTLSSPVSYGDVVTFSYTMPSSNMLQSTEGGWVNSLTAQLVTNNVSQSNPTYISSLVSNSTPSIIEITFSQNLSSSSVPPASAFSVMVNSTARNVTSVSVSGTKVNLTLSSAVAYGDAVTVAYTKPSSGALTGTSGAEVASFSARNVTNNVLSPIPAYVSSVIENATPSRLEMTYSLTLANSVPATSAFSVRVNSNARSVTSVSISGTKVILTLASAVVYGDVVTVSYTKPSSNPIKTPEGAEAASISAQPVTNRVSAVLPVYVSSVIENATPNKLEITFSLTLANSVPAPSAFNVQVNSAARTVNSVAVSGTKVILTLSSPAAYGNSVTVAYTKPSVNPIKTASGGEAASFSAKTVKNNIQYVNSPPVVVVKYPSANLSGVVAEINASGTYDVDKDNLTYQWIIPENIPVSSTTSSRIKFLSPVVNETKTYQFVLKVSDGKNVETKNVPIKVNPYKPELLTAEVTKVEASSYSYPNFPFNILDGNIGTMWAAEGDGEWLLLYLSEPFMVDHVKLAFQPGQKSESYFDILGSADGEIWEPILDKSNSCSFSGNLQVFGFPPAKTETAYSFIKLIGHNNAASNWNYISEFQIFGRYVRENRNRDLGQVVIYPNPARDMVNVLIRETVLPPDLLRIVSITGKVVYESKIEPDVKELQIPVDLINGLYIIQFESGTVTVSAQKLIIHK